jgi:UDP-N-acetylmuramate dehydrogenase
MKISENIPISKLTTMRLGGNARYVIEVTSEEDVPEAYLFATKHNLPVYVLGSGSNIIGRDKGFNGVILVNQIHGMGVESE